MGASGFGGSRSRPNTASQPASATITPTAVTLTRPVWPKSETPAEVPRRALCACDATCLLRAAGDAADELELDAAVLRARSVQLAALEAVRVDDGLAVTVALGADAAFL